MSSDASRVSADLDSAQHQHTGPDLGSPVADSVALPPAGVLTAQGRGNSSARAAAIQRMQQQAGNRAVQRAVQRSAAGETAEDDIGSRIQARAGGGSSIDPGVQRQMEGAMGADLSGVRVHTDGEADHLARSVDSVAFTTGNDIFFRAGAYNPGTPEGQHLLAHEATHTIQQAQGPVAGTPRDGGVAVSDPSDSFEQAAEQNAARVTSSMGSGGGDGGAVAAQTMPAAGMPAVQRAGDEDELPAQTMRAGQMPSIQRAVAMPSVQRAAEEDELPAQTMRQMPSVQRAADEDELPAQTMRQMPSVQRAADEDELPAQTMRAGQMPAVQRAADEDEAPVQAMAVQREASEDDEPA
jgi:hypothetical protein